MPKIAYYNTPFPMGQSYQNPYLDRLNAMQQSMQAPPHPPMQITRVNGQNGAAAFQLPPNSSILLLDENQPIIWLKTTDGAGYPTITPYQITPYQPAPQPDYQSLEQRLAKLEAAIINEQPDSTATQSGTGTNVGTN